MDLVGECIRRGTSRLLCDHHALPSEFFDLSSGVAGELVQKLMNYGIRMAAVVPDPAVYSESFRDFVREANRSDHYRFFRTRSEAVNWLVATSE